MDIHLEQIRHQKIVNLLKSKRIYDAILNIQHWIYEHEMNQFAIKLEEVQTTYNNLLTYFGVVDDPEKDSIYKKIVIECLDIADSVFQTIQQTHSTDYYYQQWRTNQRINGLNLSAIEKRLIDAIDKISMYESSDVQSQEIETRLALRREYEKQLVDLFSTIWLSNGSSIEHNEQLKKIQTDAWPREIHYLIVVATMFNLFERYSSARLQLLIDYISHPELSVSQVALTATLIAFYHHQWILETDDTLVLRFESVIEKDRLQNDIQTIILQLLQSRETEKVTKKLTEELLPEMVRLSKEVYNKFETDKNSDDTEKNPEWKSILDDSIFTDKMQELSQLQMEGADIHMMTFSSLKNSPFFRNVSNWFIPYDKNHSTVYPLTIDLGSGKSLLIESIDKSGFLCNSDKYSLCQTILQMPTQAQSMLSHRFSDESAELNEQLRNELEAEKKHQKSNLSNQFIRDLYRFIKLFPYKDSFPDLFKSRLDIYNIPFLKKGLSAESKQVIAEFLLKKEYYSESIDLFNTLFEESKSIHPELFQKVGFCYYKLGKYKEAVAEFRKAELIDSENSWTIRKIAQCYRHLEEKHKAIDYFQQAESLLPDNLSITYSIGQLYAELGQYEKALPYFYKVEFMGKDPIKAIRSIAWTLVLIKQYQKAEEYYNKLLLHAPSDQDMMNAAHTNWILGNTTNAIQLYKKAYQGMERNKETFTIHFMADKAILLTAGIKQNDIPLMLEKVTVPL